MRSTIRAALLAVAAAVLILVLILGFTGPALAEMDVAGWQFKDLSSRQVRIQFDLAFDSEKLAWIKYDSGSSDVFLLDLTAGFETRVTDTPENEEVVALDGDRLVYAAWDAGSDISAPAKIYLVNLAGGATQLIAEGPLDIQGGIQIEGDYIAWAQYDPPAGCSPSQAGGRGLYVYTISSAAKDKISGRLAYGGGSSGGQKAFDLGQGGIAYVEADSGGVDGEAFLYNLDTEATADLGPSLAASHHVSLAGDLVTWAAPGVEMAGDIYKTADIFIHKISSGSTTKIATAHAYAPLPKTDGRFVVWEDFLPHPVMPRPVIVGYDSETKGSIDVSHNLFLNFTPEISDGLVVWERGGELESEIMAADLRTGQITQLSDNHTWMDQAALVHGRTVIWWKYWFSMEPGVEPPDQMMMATAPESFVDPFTDVTGTHRYRTAIMGVSEQSIAGGYQTEAGQEFRPGAPLLRAQFAKMICEALNVPVTEEMGSQITDLGLDNPLNLYPHEYVAALAAAGVIKGKTATTFDPYTPVTRAQAISMLTRALDVYNPGLLRVIASQPPGAYYWEPPHLANLRRAYANDLLGSMVGWQERWDARVECSRGEAAQLIWNTLELIDQKAGPAPASAE
ncbi:MAG: S-layer homology domain-containing protein [Actinobacteria bacterium]|nr:S-layer homology domain-containing protein [Actinomycetota bacterium]